MPTSFHRGSSAVVGLPLTLLLLTGLRGVSSATSSLSSCKMRGSLVLRTSCTSFMSSGTLLISIRLSSFAIFYHTTSLSRRCDKNPAPFPHYIIPGCPHHTCMRLRGGTQGVAVAYATTEKAHHIWTGRRR